jgi:hypothetical protein
MNQVRPIAHDLDPGWLIALWKAIYGGDPAIDQVDVQTVAGRMIASLAQYAFGAPAAVTTEELASRLGSVNIAVKHGQGDPPGSGERRDLIVRREGEWMVIFTPLPDGDFNETWKHISNLA